MQKAVLTPLAIAISLAFTSELGAENIQLAPVTVTAAEKRPAKLQDTPLSISSFDDVYYPKTGLSDISLFNIQNAEVLRGPQSTLYGRNTEGGTINITTPNRTMTNSCPKPVCRTTGMRTL